MKKNSIRKMAVTLATLQALTMSACSNKNVESVKLDNPIKEIVYSLPINDPDVLIDLEPYYDIEESHSIMDINEKTDLYNEKGYKVGVITDYKRVKALKTNGSYTEILLENGKTVYVSANMLLEVPNLSSSNYVTVTEDKEKAIGDDANIYDSNGRCFTTRHAGNSCTVIAKNDDYSFVELSNGEQGFIENTKLDSILTLDSNKAYVRIGTKIYSDKQLTNQIDAVIYDHITDVFVDNGTYAYVCCPGEPYPYFMSSNDLEYTNDVIDVNSYGYVNNDTPLYSEKEMVNQTDTLDAYSLIYVYDQGVESDWVHIYDFNHKIIGQVRKSDITLINGDFLDVDLGEQKVKCYLDNDFVMDFNTRSGKDSTPTHTGVFDIDWKAENWEFTTYPGSYAKHWIPFNEYGEGFHDLVGDDEQNYGNEAYHAYGSHGCIRIPAAGSEYIYNNYDNGSLVLVHK